jgi:hypothetical protein
MMKRRVDFLHSQIRIFREFKLHSKSLHSSSESPLKRSLNKIKYNKTTIALFRSLRIILQIDPVNYVITRTSFPTYS